MTNYAGTVTVTSSDATLPASYTFTTADRGIKAFRVTLAKAGTTTTATDTTTATLIGTSTVNVFHASTLPSFGNLFGDRKAVEGWNW